jgi:site-specific recombinase XerD
MLKEDLAAANIPYVDSAGRYADFHSLRHSTGSLLVAAGVHPKVIQSIMRHSNGF